MILRRRREEPERAVARAHFGAVATALDSAQRALLTAIPTARDPGAPLAVALDSFSAHLEEVERLMQSWRAPDTESLWQRCNRALEESRAHEARLRSSPPGPTEFEALNARVGDVLAPLEEFADAERALSRRRF